MDNDSLTNGSDRAIIHKVDEDHDRTDRIQDAPARILDQRQTANDNEACGNTEERRKNTVCDDRKKVSLIEYTSGRRFEKPSGTHNSTKQWSRE